jgi:asparaginyl-tRNA synthetase
MKKIFIEDLKRLSEGTKVSLLGWVKEKRNHSNNVFLDIVDSTGTIQVVANKKDLDEEVFESFKKVNYEAAVEINGMIAQNNKSKEVKATSIIIVGDSKKQFSPRPRSDFDIFTPKLTNHLLSNRHMYIRNPKIMAILRFRHILMSHVRNWFNDNRFIEIDAPILTPIPLYEDGSAMKIDVHGEKVFLTQCVGYYLEAAAHAFERVYNMGPSFRGEESRSKRHLMEYWHIKAEITFGNREDIIKMVEDIISYLTKKCLEDSGDIIDTLGVNMCTDGLKTPYQRISYEDAIISLQKKGVQIKYGKGLGSKEEGVLSELFDGPFWITGIPRTIEPFPYSIDQKDNRVTMVGDLIASNGYGELLGVAEKIHSYQMLLERMKEKDKVDDKRYDWVREVHQSGCVPHIAFGMGVERLIRWLLNIPHVRDAMPFPRIFRRRVYP